MLSNFVIHLPSNVQPERFPSNSASHYSTQLNEARELDGEWDVSLIEVAYPKSVKMFGGGEKMTFVEAVHGSTCSVGGKTTKTRIHLKGSAQELCDKLNDVAPMVFDVKYSTRKGFRLEVKLIDFMIHLQHTLQDAMGFQARDFPKGVYRGKKLTKDLPDTTGLVTVMDLNCVHQEEVTLKKDGESITTAKALRTRLDAALSDTQVKLKVRDGKVRLVKESKYTGADIAVVLHETIRKALGFDTVQAATHKGTYPADRRLQFNQVAKSTGRWFLTIYKNRGKDLALSVRTNEWLVPSPRENTIESLVSTLNEKRDQHDYAFGERDGKLTLSLHNEHKHLMMNKTLADALGFAHTQFTRVQTYVALWTPSLYRNIDYVYVYSNICEYSHVGHMTAPLLHTVPFMKDGYGHLIYHPIQTPLSRGVITSKLDRIDMRLCDGNGTDIPFLEGKTMVVLQFQRRIL